MQENTIENLKRKAKRISHTQNRKLSEVQNELANEKGYPHWSLLMKEFSKNNSLTTSNQSFEKSNRLLEKNLTEIYSTLEGMGIPSPKVKFILDRAKLTKEPISNLLKNFVFLNDEEIKNKFFDPSPDGLQKWINQTKIHSGDEFPFPNTASGIVLISGTTGSGRNTEAKKMVKEFLEKTEKTRVIGLVHSQNNQFNSISENDITKLYDERYFEYNRSKSRTNLERDMYNCSNGKKVNVIYVDEIRSEKEANAVIFAASIGHLVISTIHGHSVKNAIDTFIKLYPIEKQQGIRDDLESYLYMTMHQTWEGPEPFQNPKRTWMYLKKEDKFYKEI